jgi:hypothetical protein
MSPAPPGTKILEPHFHFFRIVFGIKMQAAIDRVMKTYGMMVNLTPAEECLARERVAQFLSGRTEDESRLVVEGIKFLRGDKPGRTRRASPL